MATFEGKEKCFYTYIYGSLYVLFSQEGPSAMRICTGHCPLGYKDVISLPFMISKFFEALSAGA